MLYADFYSLEKFGRTKLGQEVLYTTISQNIHIIGFAIVGSMKGFEVIREI